MSRGFIRVLLPLALVLAVSGSGGPRVPAYLDAPALGRYDLLPSGFTVEFWIRVNSKPGFDPRIVHCVNADPGPSAYEGSAQWALFICNLSDCSPGTVLFEVQSRGESHYMASSLRVDDGAFHHVAGTYDGAALRLYVDGEPQGELPLADFEARVGGGRLVVGNTHDLNNAFDGVVDELRIWSTVRSPDAIRSGMGTGVKGTPPGLEGCWRLDENGEDASGNDNPLHPHNIVVFGAGKVGGGADIVNADPIRG